MRKPDEVFDDVRWFGLPHGFIFSLVLLISHRLVLADVLWCTDSESGHQNTPGKLNVIFQVPRYRCSFPFWGGAISLVSFSAVPLGGWSLPYINGFHFDLRVYARLSCRVYCEIQEACWGKESIKEAPISHFTLICNPIKLRNHVEYNYQRTKISPIP